MATRKMLTGLITVLAVTVLLVVGCGQNTPTTPTAKALAIQTVSLADGRVGLVYSQTLQAAGGSSPYTWSITSGSLPDGLSYSTRNGGISGTPSKNGQFNFTVQLVDSAGANVSKDLTINIKGDAVPLTTNAITLATGEIGMPYSQTLQAFGGTTPYTWSFVSGTLPDGLSLDATGKVSGTPNATGKSIFSVQVKDAAGAVATDSLTMTINARISIVTPELAKAESGVIYSQTLEATDGVGNYKWSVDSGKLPEGITLTGDTGVLFGTPKTDGQYDFTAKATDGAGASATKALTINVIKALEVLTKSLPGGTVGTPYNQTIEYAGGTGTNVWIVFKNSLPDGLKIDGEKGIISGTPTKAGKFDFTIELVDDMNAVVMMDYSITIQ